MAQDLADRDQARALPQQLPGQGVPEPMRAHVRKTGLQARPLHDVADEVGPDRPVRCSTGQNRCRAPCGCGRGTG
jgi:hypothetical protein